nr:reverse transcriptase domain-containing protein [Tanacetum cinerariifolium]
MCRRTHKARSHQCRAKEAKPKENPTEYCTKSGLLSLGWHTNDNEVSEQSGSTNPTTVSLTLDDNHHSRVISQPKQRKNRLIKTLSQKLGKMQKPGGETESRFPRRTLNYYHEKPEPSEGTPPTARKIEAWWEWCWLFDSLIILEAYFQVQRIYVDEGSSSELMYEHCFRNLEPDTRAELREYRIPLVGFSSEVNYLPGIIDLRVTMGELDRVRMVIMKFAMVKCHSSYNVILVRTRMRSLGAVASTIHSMIKFPTANEIATMVTNRETLWECRKIEEAQGPTLERRDTSLHHGTSIENLPTYRVNGPKKRSIALDRRKVVKKEVEEWLNADDMVIKSKTEQDLIQDIKETLLTLKKVNMKLNPKNFSFKIEEGKFLGYIVTYEWIIANQEKSKAVMSMPSSSNLKQMQSLSGKLVALNKFLSKVVESDIPCLDTLKKYTNKKDFRWTEAVKEAFQAMKRLIAELPTLTDAVKDDELLLYLSVAYEAVSAVLLVERKGRQLPIYYVSRSLQAETVAGDGLTYEKAHSLDSALVPKDVSESSKVRDEQTESDPSVDLDNFNNSNNDTEYEALLAGLRIARGMQEGKRVKQLEAVQCETLTNGILLEDLNKRSVDVAEVNMVVEEEGRTWMTPIREYMEKGTLLNDPAEARIVREKINNYVIEDGVLYQKSYLGLLLRCIGPLQENYVVREIHMGSCRIHDGPRRVVYKAMNTWYYWLSMHQDANHEIKGYDACQAYAAVPRLPKDDRISVMMGRGTTKAVIPVDIGMPTRRTTQRTNEENDVELRMNLNLLEERREIEIIRETRRKKQVEKYYNQRVRHMLFRTGELVLKKNKVSKAESTCKLGPK